MESILLGLKEGLDVDAGEDAKSSNARRLVPWLNWDEWIFVKDALFSNSPHSVSSALKRISAWRSRGCLPVLIEVTASIIEIHLKDPSFRVDQSNDASFSEEMLAMLYCMAIMRLVNGVVEKTRKKELVSIAVAADAIGIPRMLIDVRHEGSHRELPSLKVVRSASVKALDWLKSYYWEPQSKAIPFQGEGNAKVKKEIKSMIRELAICLKVNGSPQSNTSLLKGKRVKHGELLFGRNKLLTLMVGKSQASRSGDNPCIGVSHSRAEIRRSDYLSSLFAWLVGILSNVPSAAANMPKRVLLELLRKSLLISQLCNDQLLDSALHLAELMHESSLLERVKKLSLIGLSNLDNADDESSSLLTSKKIFQFEESIHEAAKKLELVKQQIMKNKNPTAMDCETKKSQTWTLAKSWNPCPIGMLPRAVGSSGCLPVLDSIDNQKQNQVSERKLIQHGAKRDAASDLQLLDNKTVKKMRETKEFGELNDELPTDGDKVCVKVGGVMEEELLAVESSVRILV